ncbi:hypothetical protein LLEC1_05862 [Akanthomyces lecanii]|uniref:VOC domain-containing protein n=1 Tax=Cordyceps confragosa TaxID=2714763 RepID=A0A179IDE6_CORDF|nr:hypothetical protein LLEC1_05862 [Akanthomyces lecanii]
MSLHGAHVRIARPTDDIDAVIPFYRDGLGFEMLLRFGEHAGFDGAMLGLRGAAYHLELTTKRGHAVGRAPAEDNLLIFYLPGDAAFRAAVERMRAHGFAAVASFNPYWDRKGRTYEDPDGYRIVLANMANPAV